MVAAGPRTETDYVPKCLADSGFANCIIIPEPETFHDVPWAGEGKYRVGEVLSEPHWQEGMSYMDAGPRHVARKQLQKLQDMGLTVYSAYEMEFLLLKTGTQIPAFDGQDYCCNIVMSEIQQFLFEVDQNLISTGLNIECFHTEHAPGQFEAVVIPAYGFKGADDAFYFKHGIKEMACKVGFDANFMAKPNPDEAGSGTHFNFSLWDIKTGKNAFSDLSGPDRLSKTAHYFIGGVTKHLRAVSALCAPTVNCYRRFHQPWAPDVTDWNIDDRTTSLRIKNSSVSATYMENRLPSGLCNPYLVMAATLAAGIDGIINHIDSPPKGKQGTQRLPDNLEEALQALEADQAMVEALGEEFVDWFTSSKRQVELTKLKNSDVTKNDVAALAAEFEEYAKLM